MNKEEAKKAALRLCEVKILKGDMVQLCESTKAYNVVLCMGDNTLFPFEPTRKPVPKGEIAMVRRTPNENWIPRISTGEMLDGHLVCINGRDNFVESTKAWDFWKPVHKPVLKNVKWGQLLPNDKLVYVQMTVGDCADKFGIDCRKTFELTTEAGDE